MCDHPLSRCHCQKHGQHAAIGSRTEVATETKCSVLCTKRLSNLLQGNTSSGHQVKSQPCQTCLNAMGGIATTQTAVCVSTQHASKGPRRGEQSEEKQVCVA